MFLVTVKTSTLNDDSSNQSSIIKQKEGIFVIKYKIILNCINCLISADIPKKNSIRKQLFKVPTVANLNDYQTLKSN